MILSNEPTVTQQAKPRGYDKEQEINLAACISSVSAADVCVLHPEPTVSCKSSLLMLKVTRQGKTQVNGKFKTHASAAKSYISPCVVFATRL